MLLGVKVLGDHKARTIVSRLALDMGARAGGGERGEQGLAFYSHNKL